VPYLALEHFPFSLSKLPWEPGAKRSLRRSNDCWFLHASVIKRGRPAWRKTHYCHLAVNSQGGITRMVIRILIWIAGAVFHPQRSKIRRTEYRLRFRRCFLDLGPIHPEGARSNLIIVAILILQPLCLSLDHGFITYVESSQ
jgi:hypothetical protein